MTVCPRCGVPRPSDAPGGHCPGCLIRGAARRDPLADLVGEEPPAESGPIGTIGDYELLGELGRGGMGVVFLARQVSRGRQVALKLVRAGRLATEVEIRRFRLEAEAAGRLDHPNLVTVYEAGRLEGEPFFSMRYIAGGDLHRHQPRLARLPRRAARVVATAARAVEAAHRAGIVHRDLKPANVLLAAGDVPYVCDFGIARLAEAGLGVDRPGVVLGTPGTMSPEQAAGRLDEIGPPTDVYGLGATLFEVLTGRPPFLARTIADALRAVLDTDPTPPSHLNPAVGPDLDAIVLRCLAKRPADRFPTAASLADRLDAWLGDPPRLARSRASRSRQGRGA